MADTPMTKTDLLASLREVESKLYSSEVVQEVKKQPQEQQMAFASARLHFTATISKLNAALMRDIRTQLQARAETLQEGVDSLSKSLSELEGATKWAKAINGVLGVIDQFVPLF
jgi:phosphatidylinositol kinase/protein kinase (PI-3  family)